MEACHKKIDTGLDHVYDTMLTGQASGPYVGAKVFQGFGFPNSSKGIVHYVLDNLHDLHCYSSILLDPVFEIVPELFLKYRNALR